MPEYPSLKEFGTALEDKALSNSGRTLLGELHRLVHSTLSSLVTENSPVGSGRDKHPGLLKKSWSSQPPADSITAGSESTLINTAPHMQVINRGRLQGRNSRKRGGTRMLGSLLAPKGVTKPSFSKLRSMKDDLVTQAIAKADKD